MLLETGGQNSHWGYHVPSMMNVLDFEVLNGSPGDKQTNKRLWKEVYQPANGMKSLKKKKKGSRIGPEWILQIHAWTNEVCDKHEQPWPQKHQAQSQSVHIPLTAVQHGIVTV